MTQVMRSHFFTPDSKAICCFTPVKSRQLRVERDHSILAILLQTQCSQAKAQS